MHIADLDKGILGANGMVGGGFGLATGAAMRNKYLKRMMLLFVSLVMVPLMKVIFMSA